MPSIYLCLPTHPPPHTHQSHFSSSAPPIFPLPLLFPSPSLSPLFPLVFLFFRFSATALFADARPVWWREVSRGHSSLAFFLGVNMASFIRLSVVSFHFAATYQLIANLPVDFADWFPLLLLLLFALMGLAQIISMLTCASVGVGCEEGGKK